MSSAPQVRQGPSGIRRQRRRRRFLLGACGETPGLDRDRPDIDQLIELERSLMLLRPRVRSECIDGPRPCPWVGCRYHLYLDVYTTGDPSNPVPGLIIHRADQDPSEMPESCLLDLAGRGPHTLAEIGDIFDLSRERIRQIEASALTKLTRATGVTDPGVLARILDER